MFTERGLCVIITIYFLHLQARTDYMRKIITFDSGLKVVLVPNTAVRSVSIGIFVNAGTEYETSREAGISHFIEHMVFKGTATRSAFDIANETDSIGALINAYTTKSHTCFYTTSLDTHMEKCFEVLTDMYLNPKFDPADLESERKVIFEEINESDDMPDDVCLETLMNSRYEGHPLGKPILGYKEALSKLNREDLFDYMKRRYTPDNTVVAFAGNVDESTCVALVNKYLESKLTKNQSSRVHTAHDTTAVYNGVKKDISQAHIAIAFPSYGFGDEGLYALNLMNAVFAAEMSSRLFQSIREKLGLCYTISGSSSAYEKNGAYIIYTATSPENTEAALRAIKKEIDLLVEKGITEEELKKGKEQLKTSLVLGQESTSAMMRAFGRYASITGELYDTDRMLEFYDSATIEKINEVVKYVFDFDKVTLSIVSGNPPENALDFLK